jgi:hypothetical protein
MFYINYLLALGLCVGFPAGLPVDKTEKASRPPAGKESWIVQKSSTLSIHGRTNINRFSCGVAQYTEADTITFLGEGCRGQVRGIPLCGGLRINIGDFDCRNRVMTDEFKKTLLYRQYPQLKITFLDLERMPVFGARPEILKGLICIELAGISKQVEMDYTTSREDAGTVQLTGSRQLCFSDFGLQPPQKMGGLIKVKDILDVQFVLCLQRME